MYACKNVITFQTTLNGFLRLSFQGVSSLLERWSQEVLIGEQGSETENGRKTQPVCYWAPGGPSHWRTPRQWETCLRVDSSKVRGSWDICPLLLSANGLRLLPESVSSGASSLQCPGRQGSRDQKRLLVWQSLLQLEGVELTYTRMVSLEGVWAGY